MTVAGQSFFVNGQNNLPVTVAPGGKYNFQLGFKPSGATEYAGQFTVIDTAARPIARGSIHGSGTNGSDSNSSAQLTVGPTSLKFDNVTVGSSTTQPVTLTATGTDPVTINSATLSGSNFSLFRAQFPVTLQPHQSTMLYVVFKPTTTGTASSSLVIHSNASNSSADAVTLSGEGVTESSPQLTVTPGNLGFQSVSVGSSATQTVTLISTGTAAVKVTAASISGAGFSVSGASFPLTLNPHQVARLSVQFKPSAANTYNGTLAIHSNSATNATSTVSLTGTGGGAAETTQLAVSPGSLSFGNVAVGSTGTQSVTLTSTGTGPVKVSAASISGSSFTLSGASLPVTLNPKQAVTLNVQFKPTASGAATGRLIVSSNSSAGGTTAVSLSGTGTAATTAQLAVSPGAVSFGNVAVGSTGSQSVTLTSTGTGPVKVTAASISGSGFTLSGASLPVTLNPKQAVTLNVQFKPTAAGATTGQLTVSSNSSTGGTTAVSLSGTGTAATTPQLTVSPGSASFGNVAVGSTGTQSIVLTSTGTAPVKITAATISGTGFSISGASLPATLNPKQTLALTVQFKPTAAGAATGKLTVTSNSSANSTALVSLSGTGTAASTAQLTVNLASLSFGSIAVGSTTSQAVTLTSTGTGPVNVTAATISGTGFSVSGASFPLTLNAKQTATLTVQFKPTAAGAAAGKLTISSNSSTNGTAVVSLAGTGTAASTAQLAVSPGTLSFGNVAVASTGTQTVTLTSSGTGPVKITAAAVSGTGFSVSGASFPLTLNAKQTATLTVQFKPAATGAEAGTLTISSNSSTGSTSVVTLSGTGTAATQHEVDLTWDAPSSSPVPVTGYNVYRSTGGTSSYQLLNSSPETQREYVDSTVQSGTTYDYIVKSVDAAGGESTPTSALSLTIP